MQDDKKQKVTSTVKCNDKLEKSFEIRFNDLNGNKITSIKYPSDISLLPVVTKDGYIFLGWYYDEEFKNKVETSNISELKIEKIIDKNGCVVGYKNLTLYAKWQENRQEVPSTNRKEYYCDSEYTLNGTQCSRTEVINASVYESCPDGYASCGKGMCHNESGKVSLDMMHCAEGSVGPDFRQRCVTNPNDISSQNECNLNGYRWYNGVCYSNVGDILCPDGRQPSEAGGGIDGITYYCGMYADGREGYVHVTSTYSCPDGYIQNGAYCTRTIITSAKVR